MVKGKMENYEVLKDIGFGSYGVTKLMSNKITKELVAMKFIERAKVNENVEREIINHMSLKHPNIVRLMEVLLTPTHLVIVMEYAAGGELYERIITAKAFGEDEARYFFQQLISGVSYCHYMQICHRNLKLANTLLDGRSMPILKLCDFGFSKSSVLHSAPDSTADTLVYIPPELIHSHNEYDGKLADVWSCGVTLYVMLVGEYPFIDKEDLTNWSRIMQRILDAQYKIPDSINISQDCRHLLSRIFVAPASRRITIEEIKHHPWFLKNLPWKETEAAQAIHYRRENSAFSPQSAESFMVIVGESKQSAINSLLLFSSVGGFKRRKGENNDDEDHYMKNDYMTHARKRSRYSSEGTVGFINPASMDIAVRYAHILEQNHNYFTQVGCFEDMTKLLEWWIRAMVPEDYKPKKNHRIGLSRFPATQLLTDLASHYHSECSDSSLSTSTGYANPSAIPDIVFVQVVRQVLQNAQANLPTYTRPPLYEQVTTLARTALKCADPNSQGTSTFSSDIVGEVINMVGNILTDIYEKYKAHKQELQESSPANEDSEDDITKMDEDTNDNGAEDRWIHDFGDQF